MIHLVPLTVKVHYNAIGPEGPMIHLGSIVGVGLSLLQYTIML